MTLTRTQFLLFILFKIILIDILIKLIFLMNCEYTQGKVYDHYTERVPVKCGGLLSYAEIEFIHKNQKITFYGPQNVCYDLGDKVNVAYNSDLSFIKVVSFYGLFIPDYIYMIFISIFVTGFTLSFIKPNKKLFISLRKPFITKSDQ